MQLIRRFDRSHTLFYLLLFCRSTGDSSKEAHTNLLMQLMELEKEISKTSVQYVSREFLETPPDKLEEMLLNRISKQGNV